MDVVVLEVGVGGRLDATNVVPEPVVTAVTSLGFDHMDMLGHTLAVSGEELDLDLSGIEIAEIAGVWVARCWGVTTSTCCNTRWR